MGILAAAVHLLPKASTLRHICSSIFATWISPLIRLLGAILPEPPFGHYSFFVNFPIMVFYMTLYALLTGFMFGIIYHLTKKIISK